MHFAYDPPGWHAGLGITIAALLLTACGFWVGDEDTLTAGEA